MSAPENLRSPAAALRFLIYPISTAVTTPIRFLQTLWACRVLLTQPRVDFPNLTVHKSLNNLFYRSLAICFRRHGRRSHTPLLGLGDHDLGKEFHFCWLALATFERWGARMVLACMAVWLLGHGIWLTDAPAWYLASVLIIVLFSTSFYFNFYGGQNYNALGWAFFPLGLYGIATGNYAIATAAWLLCSFGSATATIIAIGMTVMYVALTLDAWCAATILPAGVKFSTHFVNWRRPLETVDRVMRIARSIGVTARATRYKRKSRRVINLLHTTYFALTLVPLSGAIWYVTGDAPMLAVPALVILLVNGLFARFADYITIVILFLSVAVALALQNPEPWILPFLWIAVSPFPYVLGYYPLGSSFDVVPKLKPYAIEPLLESAENLLASVPEGERVLMAYADPGDDHYSVYDGYRSMFELPHFVAVRRGILCMPDWWAVFELNYVDAPEIWGRDVYSVCANLERWDANYAIVYQEDDGTLDPAWVQRGFTVLSSMDWRNHEASFDDLPPFPLNRKAPVWWLLKRTEGENVA